MPRVARPKNRGAHETVRLPVFEAVDPNLPEGLTEVLLPAVESKDLKGARMLTMTPEAAERFRRAAERLDAAVADLEGQIRQAYLEYEGQTAPVRHLWENSE